MRAVRLRSPRSRAQVRGSWLSLFAMLMIFIGPLISQAMPMDHRMPMPMGMDMSMEMPGQAGEAMAPSADEHHVPSAEHHALWEKCGYCTLLFSCPAVPQALAFIAATPPKPTGFFTVASQQGHARQTTFPNARTRAPPLSTAR